MPFTLTMPKLSPTMEAGTIAKWKKKVGEHVKVGDVIFEVATDKATVEHSVIDGGWLRAILVHEGEEALVNQAVAIFTETQQESIEGYRPEGVAPKSKEALASAAPHKEEGEVKALPAAASLGMQQSVFSPEPPLEHYTFPFPEGGSGDGRLKTSPLARKLAKDLGVDLSTVKGSGPHQRIMSRDLPLAQPKAEAVFKRQEAPQQAPGSYEEIALTPIRKVIAEKLQQSKTFIPHFYITQEIHADPLVALREQLKEGGVKVSFNDLIIRGAALALRKHPEVNSGYYAAHATILRFKTVDISVAVSIEAGLITPIVRHADYKNVGEISAEVKALAQRAREGKLAREEYMGGSFSISNLGMYGVTEFVGVINPPQAALLAVGGIEDRPIVKGGSVVVGKTLRLTLSCDHRVLDGAQGALFLKTLQHLLENPALLIL